MDTSTNVTTELKQQELPFDRLARLGEEDGMVKMLAVPVVVIAGFVALIVVVRFFQNVRERIVMQRSMRE